MLKVLALIRPLTWMALALLIAYLHDCYRVFWSAGVSLPLLGWFGVLLSIALVGAMQKYSSPWKGWGE
jgi:hypothetical protein